MKSLPVPVFAVTVMLVMLSAVSTPISAVAYYVIFSPAADRHREPVSQSRAKPRAGIHAAFTHRSQRGPVTFQLRPANSVHHALVTGLQAVGN
jgi:hypothetical protein